MVDKMITDEQKKFLSTIFVGTEEGQTPDANFDVQNRRLKYVSRFSKSELNPCFLFVSSTVFAECLGDAHTLRFSTPLVKIFNFEAPCSPIPTFKYPERFGKLEISRN